MDDRRRQIRRKQLDALFSSADNSLRTPKGGWIRAIRQSLGMSLETLANRIGVKSKSSVYQLEQAEVDGSLTIKRLLNVADALDCDLRIVVVPRVPLSQMVTNQARKKAIEQLTRAGHSMAMEDQEVDRERFEALISSTAGEIRARAGAELWE
ncbi:mobile mystery protein A [soil metagenome]